MRILLALIALSGFAFADSAGKYGNGRTQPRVTVETRMQASQNQLQVRFTHNGETSEWRNASEDPNGDGFDVLDSTEGADTGGKNFRFKGGKAQYKNGQGVWVNLGRKRKGNPAGSGGAHHITAGTPLPSDGMVRPASGGRWFPATAGTAFSYDIFFIPGGDDVTTLPDDPNHG